MRVFDFGGLSTASGAWWRNVHDVAHTENHIPSSAVGSLKFIGVFLLVDFVESLPLSVRVQDC